MTTTTKEKLKNQNSIVYGDEPRWNTVFVSEEDRDCAILRAINWYNSQNVDASYSEWLSDYMKNEKYPESDIQTIAKSDGKDLLISYGEMKGVIGFNPPIIARMCNLGAPIPAKYRENLKNCVDFVVRRITRKRNSVVSTSQEPAKTVNIQEIVNKYCDEVIADLDTFSDNIMSFGTAIKKESDLSGLFETKTPPKNYNFDLKGYLEGKNLKGMHCSKISAYYANGDLKEMLRLVEGKDSELKEAYSSYPTQHVKNVIAFYQDILKFCQEISESSKKFSESIRPRRKQAPGIAVKNLQYMTEFPELNIRSVTPTKIVGASRIILYNVKYKKLSIIEANDVGGLSVKGTTVIHMDDAKSFCKILRKPEKFFADIKGKGIREIRKVFDSLTTDAKPANGRCGEDTIIVECF